GGLKGRRRLATHVSDLVIEKRLRDQRAQGDPRDRSYRLPPAAGHGDRRTRSGYRREGLRGWLLGNDIWFLAEVAQEPLAERGGDLGVPLARPDDHRNSAQRGGWNPFQLRQRMIRRQRQHQGPPPHLFCGHVRPNIRARDERGVDGAADEVVEI